MKRSRWRPRLVALLTALFASVGLLGLSTAPAWAATGTVTEFNDPSGAPFGITAGPDGNLWFTNSASTIGRITTSGSVTEFKVGGVCVANEGCEAFGITSGPDGNLWFTEGASDTTNTIGRLTTTGSFTAFPLPRDGSDGSRPRGITAGPDGNLWFSEELAAEIGRITTS